MQKPNLQKLGFALLFLIGTMPQTQSLNIGLGVTLSARLWNMTKLGIGKSGVVTGKFGPSQKLQELLNRFVYNSPSGAPANARPFTAKVAAAGAKSGEDAFPIQRDSGVPGTPYTNNEELIIGEAGEEGEHNGYLNAVSYQNNLAGSINAELKAGNDQWAQLAGSGELSDISAKQEFDVEVANFGRALALLLNGILTYDIEGTVLSVGGAFDIGASFVRLKAKGLSGAELTNSEAFTARAALVLGITRYFELHAGLGTVRNTIAYKALTDLQKSVKENNELISNAQSVAKSFVDYDQTNNTNATTDNLSSVQNNIKPITIANSEQSKWTLFAHVAALVKVPFSDALEFVFGARVTAPMTKASLNSKDSGEIELSSALGAELGVRYKM